MISSTPVKSSFIIHISRPVKALIRKFSLALLFILAISGIIIGKIDSPITNDIRTKITDITSPVIGTMSVPVNFISNFKESMQSYFFVHKKNENLVKENERLKTKLINLSGIAYENERLKELLNYAEQLKYNYISAKVVGNTSGPFYSSIIINAGTSDNVKKGQAVVNEEGLVGRIIEVGEKSSRVLLLTDINSNIPVITSRSREPAIMSGNNNEMPRLRYLSNETKTEELEVVKTSGDGDVYPYGLHVGVIKIDASGTRYVQPFVELHKLEHLSVIDYSGQ
ncbi:MAG: rod shape-determining protein MreC [Rickettsiales bacterium]|nr:rod shape-determining protein MreC [Pseudomonadota bacterium]MDA0966423.1 rod shape-determining protein MreC [Pseudomonadota bacterium]MDG4543285.1 rod shape-determining protein MreC [Rickettsiales bacterium]MDG4545551.1 rod shape-determining protein MreC [Rickettsiales bacterium]MDG4548000.1 rod shape-determining protein MreC [Rickettsiales bacterium]